jgi:hypothetical protein
MCRLVKPMLAAAMGLDILSDGASRFDGKTWTPYATAGGLPSKDVFTVAVPSPK